MQVTSQHPYAEDFISEPYVYTFDIGNLEEVESVVKKALHSVDSQQVSFPVLLNYAPSLFSIGSCHLKYDSSKLETMNAN